MALFHFHVGQIKRSAGQSIVTSAAYRAGEKLYSEYYGEVSDYTHKPYRGTVQLNGSVGVLPQVPQTLFVKKIVRKDLLELLKEKKVPEAGRVIKAARVVTLCRLDGLLDRYPYDPPGRTATAALAKVLLLEPDILLLDERTKGLDAEFKQAFAEILQTLLRQDATVLMVSHDIEFCARYAHRCILFFDGSIAIDAAPRHDKRMNVYPTEGSKKRFLKSEDLLQEFGRIHTDNEAFLFHG